LAPGDLAAAVVADDGSAPGRIVDKVVLEIDYAIIEHFSRHLYGSPNKAIEELVANAFDAMAKDVFVYVPGAQVIDRVLVWDDGLSMDQEAMKKLWWIARSPKMESEDRRASASGLEDRLMIGKFGIGKLASYQVGHGIAHLTKCSGTYLLVDVDYREVQSELEAGPKGRFETPIYALTEQQARKWVQGMFIRDARALTDMWGRPTWTLAAIRPLKDIDIPAGRLAWVLSNSMPLRPDFRIAVNDEPVTPRILAGAFETLDLGSATLRDAVLQAWNRAKSKGDVTGDIKSEEPVGAHPGGPGLVLPNLGVVRAQVRLFPTSLAAGAAAEYGRSHGFFLRVRERLVNLGEPLLLFRDPSFGTFYRTQFMIFADGLDQDLLADRERLRIDTPRTKEFEVLQDGLYMAARQRFERFDQDAQKEARSEALLPLGDRTHFREPFTSLLVRSGRSGEGLDISQAHIEREDLTDEDPIAGLDDTGIGFRVNTAHPFVKAVRDRLGTGKNAREALRAIDLLAVSERLLEGFLYDIGIEEAIVTKIIGWRDGLLRSLAVRYAVGAHEVFDEAMRTSYRGKAEFERALAALFGLMGFQATRHGQPGKADVLVISPTGESEVKFTIEGKGSKVPVPNDAAEVAGASAHRETAGAQHALIVAREFAGFERGGNAAAILGECRAVANVSIVTVETLIDLARAVEKFYYPLDLILPILAEVETPESKRKRVAELASPVENFDFRRVLEEIWKKQQKEAAGDVVAFRALWQEGWKGKIEFDDFKRKLAALEAMAGGLIRLRLTRNEVTLLQSPTVIAQKIQESLDLG
jgi:hypothetical protein